MFHDGRFVLAFDVREGVRATAVADQQRVALGEVTRTFRTRAEFHQTAVGVGAAAGGDALGDDGAPGVFTQVDHLGAGVGLLVVVGEGDGVELAYAVLTTQHTARVFPSDGGAGFYLGPGNLGVFADAGAALGDEVVDAAFAVFVARVPVLYRGVFDLGVVQGDQFYHRSVQLVFVPHGGGAAFQVAYVAAFFGDDQGAFELAGVGGINPEVGRQFHGAANALRDVHERAVREHRRVQGGKVVVADRDDAAQIFFHQLGVFMHRFGDGAEDNAGFFQGLFEGGGY